jgi:hypothetical protein
VQDKLKFRVNNDYGAVKLCCLTARDNFPDIFLENGQICCYDSRGQLLDVAIVETLKRWKVLGLGAETVASFLHRMLIKR